MRSEILVDLINFWVWVKLLIICQPEETSIRIKTGLEELCQKFSEETPTVNAGLV